MAKAKEVEMEFGKVVRDRYACKKYSNKKVEREKLEAVLEAGRLVLTAKNLQEQHIYVLESQEADKICKFPHDHFRHRRHLAHT